jgi:5-methylcytosine-specific restriction endonuclease McrA
MVDRSENVTQDDIMYVVWCIKNDMHRFYTWKKWIKIRTAVLLTDKYECQDCKKQGRYTRATTVHHVNHVKAHPELALEINYIDVEGNEKRNLVSLCFDCHEKRHGYRKHNYHAPITEERW